MEGLKTYGRYFELNIDDIFALKIDLNNTNRNEYLLMNLLNTGGSINPYSLGFIYSNRSTQANVDFGNRLKLNDYKKLTQISSSLFEVTNADGSIDEFTYHVPSQKIRNLEKNLLLEVEQDFYSSFTKVAILSQDETEVDLNTFRKYPLLVSKGEKRIIYEFDVNNRISKISNNVDDEIEFEYLINRKIIRWKKNSYLNRKIDLIYDDNENLTKLEIRNNNDILLNSYTLSLSLNGMVITNDITNQRTTITFDNNQTLICEDFTFENSKAHTYKITYSEEDLHTLVENLDTGEKNYYVYDYNERIRNIIYSEKHLEYLEYDDYKLIKKSSLLTLKEEDDSLLTNGFFTNLYSSWHCSSASPGVYTNGTGNKYLYEKILRLPYKSSIYQDVDIDGTSFDSVTLMFAYTNGDECENFSLKASITLYPKEEGGEEVTKEVTLTEGPSYTEYRFYVMSLKAKESFSKVRVKFFSQGYSAYISGVQLFKKPSVVEMLYDEEGQLFNIEAKGKENRINKDDKGNVVNASLGNTYFEKSILDNKESIIQDYGVKVVTTKDEFDRVVKKEIISQNQRFIEEYSYDGDDLIKESVSPFSEEYTYQEVDKLPSTYLNKEGVLTSYSYNDKSLLSKITKDNKDINYEYSSKDQLVRFNSYVNEYDEYGRLTKVKLDNEDIVSYSYNDDDTLNSKTENGCITTYTYENNKVKTITKDNKTYTYSYDSLDRLTRIEEGEDPCAIFEYDDDLLKKEQNEDGEVKYIYALDK